MMSKYKFNVGDKVMIIKPKKSSAVSLDRVIFWTSSMDKHDKEITLVTSLNKDGTVRLKGMDRYVFHTSWLHMVKPSAKKPERPVVRKGVRNEGKRVMHEKYALRFASSIVELLKYEAFFNAMNNYCLENDMSITEAIAKMSVDMVRKIIKDI